MHPVLILLVGVVIVIGGVLFLRLHAFLALVLAALVVALLTPTANIEGYWIGKNKISRLDASALEIKLDDERDLLLDTNPGKGATVGSHYFVLRREYGPDTERHKLVGGLFDRHNTASADDEPDDVLDKSEWSHIPFASSADENGDEELTREELKRWQPPWWPVGELKITRFDSYKDDDGETQTCAVASPLEGSDAVHAADIVIHPLELNSARSSAKQTVGERVAGAFGNTCAKIGILIALAAIIGKCLLDSGAADRIVRSALKVVGERGAPVAFICSGFLLGVPVFFDTVFYLMIPLGKALRMRTGRNYVLYVLTIVAGASMAHSLVPPTPGPLFVAEELGVDLGVMIVAGCIVGLFTSTAALFYAHFMNRRFELPLRESPDFSLEDIEKISKRDESELPSLVVSLLPIVLPVICIAGFAVIKSFGLLPKDNFLYPIAATLGNKNIALAIATIIALATLVRQKKTKLKELSGSIQGALASGGVIILITAGGGAFGAVLQQTGVASLLNELDVPSQWIIVLAFLITTAVRTAQGSATVAMITAVGILAGFVDQLEFHPVYLALAIGCGSKPVAWMNDSGFWVICKMSGMTEGEGLKFVTPMSILMGLVGLGATLVGATLLPLA